MSKGIDESHSGRIVGTAGYMSPEQVRGLPIDHRTDIFALGAVLYEMFTGARAFKRASTVETMNAILNEEPLDPWRSTPSCQRARLPSSGAAWRKIGKSDFSRRVTWFSRCSNWATRRPGRPRRPPRHTGSESRSGR